MNSTLTSLAAAFVLAEFASADVVVTLKGTGPEGPAVKIANPAKGTPSSTTARFKANKASVNGVAETDRDFGQTFTTGNEGFFLDRITVQFANVPIAPGVFGASVSVQLFEVSGSATINDNGTKTGKVADWSDDPRIDDFFEGETYTSLSIARGGRMPAFLVPGQLMVLNLRTTDRIKLKPQTQYAFLFMFDEAGVDRALSFATTYWSDYTGGHAIRRDGDIPDGMKLRASKQPTTKAGTKSDVFSDLVFWIEGSDSPDVSTAMNTVSTTADDHSLPLPAR